MGLVRGLNVLTSELCLAHSEGSINLVIIVITNEVLKCAKLVKKETKLFPTFTLWESGFMGRGRVKDLEGLRRIIFLL